jgi:hypothetical protein
MHKPSIAQAVYNATFPRPKSADPTSFSVHITRNLVPEVRIETSAFYGSLDCIEAQYPGLDYSYGPHRMRLSRFPWHRKLFRVFDDLRLTEAEIASLCRWEGTKSARERYEKEEGVKVNDTTADNVRPATPSPLPSARFPTGDDSAASDSEHSAAKGGPVQELLSIVTTTQNETDDGDFSDEEMESYGVQLNQRLIYATAARERGDNMPLDEDWEQWLKEAVERGSYSDMLNAVRTGQPLETRSNNPASPIPSSSSSSSSSSPGAALMGQLAIAAQQPVVRPDSVFSNTSGVAR